jgi:hypothetical protein
MIVKQIFSNRGYRDGPDYLCRKYSVTTDIIREGNSKQYSVMLDRKTAWGDRINGVAIGDVKVS